jgi:CheY-like chemotaxis protein
MSDVGLQDPGSGLPVTLRVVLIEDDPVFADLVCQVGREEGFLCHVGSSGTDGLRLVRGYKPNGVILDWKLPDMTGEEVLRQIKEDPETSGIPVHILSAINQPPGGLHFGEVNRFSKPISRARIQQLFARVARCAQTQLRKVLVVEQDSTLRERIDTVLGEDPAVEIVSVATGKAAFERLQRRVFDVIILDLDLSDVGNMAFFDWLEAQTDLALPRLFVLTGPSLSEEAYARIQTVTDSIILKGENPWPRLREEMTLFLHEMAWEEPAAGSEAGGISRALSGRRKARDKDNVDAALQGKKVLIVDDDMRNTFALSRALQMRGLDVRVANQGKRALELLDREPDMDIVLMDVMMPVMDGYQTMENIRIQERFTHLPIIALTAKAGPNDPTLCRQAGASDYLPKPVVIDVLVDRLKQWMS